MTDSLVSSPPGSPLTPEPEDCNLDAFIEDKRWIIPETPPCFAQLPDTLTSDTSQTFSDCTVIYGSGKKIMKLSVHKSVLCVRSGFFKGVFAGDFKEGQTNTVTLSEDKEDDIEKMFTFLYSSKYCIGGCDNEICDGCGYINGSFNVHANMYALADKYLIPDLKAYARKKFKKMLKLLDSTAKCAEPFEACHARTLNDLFYALPVLNKNTPDSDRGLRQMANHAISQNIGCIEEVDMLARAMIGNNDLCYNLLRHITHVTSPSITDKKIRMSEGVKFALDMLTKLANEAQKCERCGETMKVSTQGRAEKGNLTVHVECKSCAPVKKRKLSCEDLE